MEVEMAIVLSLSEPLYRDKLLTKTNEFLRKSNQKPTHKTKFNTALKKLVSDGWVIRLLKNKDGKVFYELEMNRKVTAKTWFVDFLEIQEKRMWFVIVSLRKIGEEILEKHENKTDISTNEKSKYSAIVFSALFLLLEYQKYLFFMKTMPLTNPSMESTIEKQIKNIEDLLSLILNPIARVLDTESLLAIHNTAISSMESSINRHVDDIKIIQKYFQEKT